MMMQAYEYSNPNKYRTVHYWLSSSLRSAGKKNDFEFGENKAKLTRLLTFASFHPSIAPVIVIFFFRPFASF
jgi:hypothetical protein